MRSVVITSTILAVATLLLTAFGQDHLGAGDMRIERFKVMEYGEDGELTWSLFGDHAVVGKKRVALTGAQANLSQGTSTNIVRSPACIYEPDARMLRGEDGVTMFGRGVVITGEGFDLDLDRQELIVRRQVVIQITRSPLAALGKTHNTE